MAEAGGQRADRLLVLKAIYDPSEGSQTIDTVKVQLRSPKPKLHVIRDSLLSARAALEVATGTAAAVGLLDLPQHVRL